MSTKSDIELHVAGATVQHSDPFKELISHVNEQNLENEFIKKWVVPFYSNNFSPENKSLMCDISNIEPYITKDISKLLLGDFNWRTRKVGALFSAIKDYKELENIIGTHLLKSELCFAGKTYCLALAVFNTETSINYLHEYLNYYLKHKDLDFDQGQALAAISYLDKVNGTNNLSQYIERWNEFIAEKDHLELINIERNFSNSIHAINIIKKKEANK